MKIARVTNVERAPTMPPAMALAFVGFEGLGERDVDVGVEEEDGDVPVSVDRLFAKKFLHVWGIPLYGCSATVA